MLSVDTFEHLRSSLFSWKLVFVTIFGEIQQWIHIINIWAQTLLDGVFSSLNWTQFTLQCSNEQLVFGCKSSCVQHQLSLDTLTDKNVFIVSKKKKKVDLRHSLLCTPSSTRPNFNPTLPLFSSCQQFHEDPLSSLMKWSDPPLLNFISHSLQSLLNVQQINPTSWKWGLMNELWNVTDDTRGRLKKPDQQIFLSTCVYWLSQIGSKKRESSCLSRLCRVRSRKLCDGSLPVSTCSNVLLVVILTSVSYWTATFWKHQDFKCGTGSGHPGNLFQFTGHM